MLDPPPAPKKARRSTRVGGRIEHPVSSIEHRVVGWERTRRARVQWAQVKPLPQVCAEGDGALPLEVLAKLDTWRSTCWLSQLGQVTPSDPASIF